jgi:hypothetical protein
MNVNLNRRPEGALECLISSFQRLAAVLDEMRAALPELDRQGVLQQTLGAALAELKAALPELDRVGTLKRLLKEVRYERGWAAFGLGSKGDYASLCRVERLYAVRVGRLERLIAEADALTPGTRRCP